MTQQFLERTSPDTCQVTCQRCWTSKDLRIQQLAHLKRPLDVKCRCGHQFQVVHDRRHHARKSVELMGYLFEPSTRTLCDNLTITDLSLGGVGFMTQQLYLQVGERYTIGFFLDDASGAWIEDGVTVQNVYHDHVIGAVFTAPAAYNFDLDFYLSAFSVIDQLQPSG